MHRDQENGFTLVELIVVVVILVMAAAVAAPTFKSSVDEKKLDAVVSEVISAAEFARSESRRTREAMGFCIDAPGRLAVVKMLTPNAAEILTAAWNNSIPHPIDKRAYVVDFSDSPHLQGVDVVFNPNTSTPFYFDGVVAGSECVYFDAEGMPFISSTGGNTYRLLNSSITLQLGSGTTGGASRQLRVQPLSGLVLEI